VVGVLPQAASKAATSIDPTSRVLLAMRSPKGVRDGRLQILACTTVAQSHAPV
jgi:predicted secreted protein